MMIKLTAAFLFFFSLQISKANEEVIPKVLLKYSVQSLSTKSAEYLTVNFENNPHWHTYWKNPGDAGFGPRFKFLNQSNQEVKLNALDWPSPSRYIEPGEIWAYGYEGSYTFFFELPKNYNNKLTLETSWLICKHICIPGKSSAKIQIERSIVTEAIIREGELQLDQVSFNKMKDRLAQIPSENPQTEPILDMVLAREPTPKNTLALYYNTNRIEKKTVFRKRNLIFPYPHPFLDFKHENLFADKNGSIYAKMQIEWNGMYEEPEIPFPKNNQLNQSLDLSFNFYDQKSNKYYRIKKSFSKLYDGDNLNNFLKILTPIKIHKSDRTKDKAQNATSNEKEKNRYSFIRFILFALLGGFILNFMPCVLPVISLKIFGLVNQKNQSQKEILKHNMLYSAGVISTFFILSLVVMALKKSGQAIGWGFQMQSPTFIASISIFLSLFSFNLFGLYEFITPGGNTLGSIKTDGAKGDFLNGVLATILSTPCSAPFLGTALAFAFTSGPATILAIFISVGIGLSSPFLVTAIFPKTISLFPRPGNWMITFKKFLGISLFLTVCWLVSIFLQLNTSNEALYILIGLIILLPASLYVYQHVKKNIIIPSVSIAVVLFGLYLIKKDKPNIPVMPKSIEVDGDYINKFGLKWARWNPDIINEYQAKKRTAFVDFTADWCLTCKVNEKLVINTDSFKSMVSEYNVDLIMGDWTNGDPAMTNWLQKNQMAGVPAYFVIDKYGNLHNLGETVSVGEVKKLLKD